MTTTEMTYSVRIGNPDNTTIGTAVSGVSLAEAITQERQRGGVITQDSTPWAQMTPRGTWVVEDRSRECGFCEYTPAADGSCSDVEV